MRTIILICMGVWIFVGCKKHEIPLEQTGTPYFEFSAELNSDPVVFIAGEENVYHAPSSKIDERQIIHFESSFLHSDANVDRQAITISLTDDHISTDGSSDALDLLNANQFHFHENATDAYYSVQFEPELLGDPVSILWDFGDGETSTEERPLHRYVDASLKKYSVCLDVSFANGCSSQLCSEVAMPDASCSADFTAVEKSDSLAGNYWDYFALAQSGKEPFTYYWTFEESVVGHSNHIWYQYVVNPDDGIEYTCVNITDAEGCVSTICKNVLVDSNIALCATNFDYKADYIETTDSINLNRANVIYTNESGVEYSSANVVQPDWARMYITSVASYPIDFNGKSTVTSKVALTCVLVSEDGDQLVLQNGRGTMGFLSGHN